MADIEQDYLEMILYTWRKRLMTHKRVFTTSGFYVPDSDTRVQTSRNHVGSIKLEIV